MAYFLSRDIVASGNYRDGTKHGDLLIYVEVGALVVKKVGRMHKYQCEYL